MCKVNFHVLQLTLSVNSFMKHSIPCDSKFLLAKVAWEVKLVFVTLLVMKERRNKFVGFSANLVFETKLNFKIKIFANSFEIDSHRKCNNSAKNVFSYESGVAALLTSDESTHHKCIAEHLHQAFDVIRCA